MTAKDYLKQISLLEARYKTKLEEVTDMRLLAESTGAIRYDKDHVITSPSGEGMINAIIRITEAESKAMKAAYELAEKKQEIIDKIIQLDDERCMRLLCLYYVKHLKLDEVAKYMRYSSDRIRHLHQDALTLFEETYPEIKKIS